MGKRSAVNALLRLLSPELWVKLVRSKALSFLLEIGYCNAELLKSPFSVLLIPATSVSFLHKWPVKMWKQASVRTGCLFRCLLTINCADTKGRQKLLTLSLQ